MELCGGTHVQRAGDIGLFKIVSETGVAAGVRRIEAITGQAALDYVERIDALLGDVAQLVRGSREDAADKVREALERIRQLEKENRALKDKLALGQGTTWPLRAVDVEGVKVLATRVDGADAGALRAAVDQLKSRLGRPSSCWLGGVGFEGAAGRGCDGGSDRAREGGGTNRQRSPPK